jgi:hypothetical protein
LNATAQSSSVQDLRAKGWIVAAFAVLTFLGIWPALTNGQPFFYADTTAYVRGADLAISKVFGNWVSTDWAKDQSRAIEGQNTFSVTQGFAGEQRSVQRVVLAGRSIIYGSLLYAGEVLGGMWLSVLFQSIIATYLIFIFVLRVLKLTFRHFIICSVFLFVASPLPFFVSYLMPDVLAGFLILDFTILAAGWRRLKPYERAILIALQLFCVVAHFSHLLLAASLTLLLSGYVALVSPPRSINVRALTTVVAGCLVIACLWEATFSLAVKKSFGAPPVRPPFVTAKLVSMLGQPAIASVCESNDFVVCRFQDRFPIDDKTFLWSVDPRAGVFNVADADTKRSLDDEQARFALAVVPQNLGRFVAGVLRDALRQLTHISLDEYAYTARGLLFYKERVPSQEFQKMAASRAARSDIYVRFGRTALCGMALISGIGTILFLGVVVLRPAANDNENQHEENWSTAAWILLAGVILNAVICGGFSDINNRYEARVIWLMQLSFITGICALERSRKITQLWERRIRKYGPFYSRDGYAAQSGLAPH